MERPSRPEAADAAGTGVLPRAAAIAAARAAVRRGRRAPAAASAVAPAAPRPAPAQPAPPSPEARRAARWAAVTDRLPLWLQLRCGVELKTVAAVTVVLLVAVGFAVQHFRSGRPQTVRAPVAQVHRHSAVPQAGPVAATAGGRITVDVAGDVENPGVRELPRGSRVTDALAAAGGPKPGTDLQNLNQARRLVDGEQIVVGAAPAPGAASAGAAGVAGTAVSGRVSLSAATPEQLETLPGIGPVLAQHIIDYRTAHAGFSSVGQLRDVSGIGEHRFAELKPKVSP
jgi:competence protein ComEA